MSGALTGIVGATVGVVALPSGLSSTSPSAGAVTIELQNDGDYVSADDGTGEWVTPSETTVAALYEARASSLAGDTGSATGTFDSWLDLATSRVWGLSGTSVSITFTLEVRDKATQTVLDSVSCSCSVGA